MRTVHGVAVVSFLLFVVAFTGALLLPGAQCRRQDHLEPTPAAAGSSGQGLEQKPGTGAALGASASVMRALSNSYRQSVAWQRAWRSRGARSVCGASGLCASGDSKDLEGMAVLEMATSPPAYDASNPSDTGVELFLPSGDQRPCYASVAFAVAAAARAAYMSGTEDRSQDVKGISEYDLHHCSAGRSSECTAGWNIEDALKQLKERPLTTATCLPYTSESSAGDPAVLCASSCRGSSHPAFSKGSFEFEPLQSAWEVQRHIRRHGAVITRFNMDPGFEPFYADAARRGQVYVRKGPAPAPGAGQSTAVLLVGYNLDTQTWKVRHSWGQDFADNGYFRLPFEGAAGLLSPSDTFGMKWKPANPTRWRLPILQEDPSKPGCYFYVARPGDHLSKVAFLAGMDVGKLLMDNLDVIPSLDRPLAGTRLRLCGIDTPQRALPRLVRAAAINGSLGFSLPWSGGAVGYQLGALEVLRATKVADLLPPRMQGQAPAGRLQAALLQPGTTRVVGTGEGAILAAALCGGVPLPKLTEAFNMRRKRCGAPGAQMCFGSLDTAYNQLIQGLPWAPGAAQQCRNKAFVSITTGVARADFLIGPDPTDDSVSGRHTIVSDFTSLGDLQSALTISSHLPVEAVSGTGRDASFRGKPAHTGLASMPLPECPAGSTYCVRVSVFPAPNVRPGIPLNTGAAMTTRAMLNNQPSAAVTLQELVADAPAAERAAKQGVRAKADAGWEISKAQVDIAPGLLAPLPGGIDERQDAAWRLLHGLQPDERLERFLYDQGAADARAWVRFIRDAP